MILPQKSTLCIWFFYQNPQLVPNESHSRIRRVRFIRLYHFIDVAVIQPEALPRHHPTIRKRISVSFDIAQFRSVSKPIRRFSCMRAHMSNGIVFRPRQIVLNPNASVSLPCYIKADTFFNNLFRCLPAIMNRAVQIHRRHRPEQRVFQTRAAIFFPEHHKEESCLLQIFK